MSKRDAGPWPDRLDEKTRKHIRMLEALIEYYPGDKSPTRDALGAAIDRLSRPKGWPDGAPLPSFVPPKGSRVQYNAASTPVIGKSLKSEVFTVTSTTPFDGTHNGWAVMDSTGNKRSIRFIEPARNVRTITVEVDASLTDEQVQQRFDSISAKVV